MPGDFPHASNFNNPVTGHKHRISLLTRSIHGHELRIRKKRVFHGAPPGLSFFLQALQRLSSSGNGAILL
jgi:hypothetical protein